jgi:hypothetical protein
MPILPSEALPLLAEFAPLFTRPTYRRSLALAAAALLTTGRRTVANLLRTLRGLASPTRVQSRWPTVDPFDERLGLRNEEGSNRVSFTDQPHAVVAESSEE